MNAIIGYTGLVGQNLDDSNFEERYNSQNIQSIKGRKFDTIVCAGVPGNKTLANQFPDRDWSTIAKLLECLKEVQCERFILISTFDVYSKTEDVDEDTSISEIGLNAYGCHRVRMELIIKKMFPQCYIVRLPGIFGKGLKKNLIFDLMFQIPRRIDQSQMTLFKESLMKKQYNVIRKSYMLNDDGMWELSFKLNKQEIIELRKVLQQINYTSLQFTDSRSMMQFYDLSHLKNDIKIMIKNQIHILNIATEPMSAKEIADKAFNIDFDNEIVDKLIWTYSIKSKHGNVFNGKNGYLYNKNQVIFDVTSFSNNYEV